MHHCFFLPVAPSLEKAGLSSADVHAHLVNNPLLKTLSLLSADNLRMNFHGFSNLCALEHNFFWPGLIPHTEEELKSIPQFTSSLADIEPPPSYNFGDKFPGCVSNKYFLDCFLWRNSYCL